MMTHLKNAFFSSAPKKVIKGPEERKFLNSLSPFNIEIVSLTDLMLLS